MMKSVRRKFFPLAAVGVSLLAALVTLHQLIGRWWPGRELLQDLAILFVAGIALLGLIGGWVRDLSRADRPLVESEALYRSLVESMDDLLFTLDAQQRFTAAFGRWLERHGLPSGALVGKTARQVFGDDYATRHEAAFQRLLTGKPATYEWSSVLGGGTRFFETSISPLFDDAGRVSGAVGVTRDVTGERQLERAYSEAGDLLEAVIAASPVAIFTLDDHGRIRTANAAAESIFGKAQAELMGELLVRPAESDEVARLIRDCATSGKPFTGVEVMRWRDDGRGVALSISAAPLGRERSAGSRVVALASDISERRRAGAVLERYRLMAQHLREAVLFVGANGRIVEANEGAAALYGWPKEELVGLAWSALTGRESGTPIEAAETSHFHRDGQEIAVEVSAVAAEIDGESCRLVLARSLARDREPVALASAR